MYCDTDTYIDANSNTNTNTNANADANANADSNGKYIRHSPLLLESSSWPSAKCGAQLDR
jgi:hypothetical protein